jgi:hypothetical protein
MTTKNKMKGLNMNPYINNDGLNKIIKDMAAQDSGYAIAYALIALTEAQWQVATELKNLGNGSNPTPMGAIEMLGVLLGKKIDNVARAIGDE